MRTVRVETCPLANQEHQHSHRQYAHVFHYDRLVCVAKAFWDLPERIRLAILLHEVGHILAGEPAGEKAANNAIERASGIDIQYRDSEWGENLEWIRPDDVVAAKEYLGIVDVGLRTHPGYQPDASAPAEC